MSSIGKGYLKQIYVNVKSFVRNLHENGENWHKICKGSHQKKNVIFRDIIPKGGGGCAIGTCPYPFFAMQNHFKILHIMF